MNHRALLRQLQTDCLDLLFPTRCLGCDVRHTWWCDDCHQVSTITRPLAHCQLCNRLVAKPGGLCADHRQILGLAGLASYGDYHSRPLKRAVQLVKYHGIWAGVPALVTTAFLRAKPMLDARRWDAIVPMPLHATRRRERGFNQAEVIAKAIEALLSTSEIPARNDSRSDSGRSPNPSLQKRGVPSFSKGNVIRQPAESIVSTELVRVRDTGHQTELGREERKKNIAGAFAWTGDRITGDVLLVDDVLTTGATMREAARVLRNAGARSVWGLTLAYET